jgi:hypothetical protein
MEDTPFMMFWAAINAQLVRDALPELLFGEAKDIFEDTLARARRTSRVRLMAPKAVAQ